MSEIIDPEDAEHFANFDKLGVQQVRLLMSNGGLPETLNPIVLRWLAHKDQEETREKEASQAEQIEIARSAKATAWFAAQAAERAATAAGKANRRATVAIIMAAISTAVMVTGIWFFHHDAPRSPRERPALSTEKR